MKVLLVNSSDITGGAARAAYRLHKGLIYDGLDSSMLVQFKHSNDPTVESAYSSSRTGKLYSWMRPAGNELVQKLQYTTNPVLHSANFLPSGLHKKINNSDADIVHLHWLGKELISVSEIAKITKPIVWTLHDMWAFSGAEHYVDLRNSRRYRDGYSVDNRPAEYGGIDIDKWTWERKRKQWKDQNFYLVTPSRWLARCVKKSMLFTDEKISVIPNGIDSDVYKPVPKEVARNILNLEKKTKYILFGALSATSDSRKGYQQLKKALDKLEPGEWNRAPYKLLIFGSDGYGSIKFNLPTTFLGKLNDNETLALAYSAADVMVVPSLQDNLPNTAVEAVLCGTPVVAFNTGGLPDIVNHKVSGYLAESFNVQDLANGINWVLEDRERNSRLSQNARIEAVKKYDINIAVEKYKNVYKELLQ